MIKINNYGTTVFYQNSNEYNLPNCTGAVQWNGSLKRFEVSNGSGWSSIDNNITLTTSSDIDNIIAWVKFKMQEEEELKKLAQTNPTIADLVNQLDKIKEKIKIVQTLTK